MPYSERLKELNTLSLSQRGLRGYLITLEKKLHKESILGLERVLNIVEKDLTSPGGCKSRADGAKGERRRTGLPGHGNKPPKGGSCLRVKTGCLAGRRAVPGTNAWSQRGGVWRAPGCDLQARWDLDVPESILRRVSSSNHLVVTSYKNPSQVHLQLVFPRPVTSPFPFSNPASLQLCPRTSLLLACAAHRPLCLAFPRGTAVPGKQWEQKGAKDNGLTVLSPPLLRSQPSPASFRPTNTEVFCSLSGVIVVVVTGSAADRLYLDVRRFLSESHMPVL